MSSSDEESVVSNPANDEAQLFGSSDGDDQAGDNNNNSPDASSDNSQQSPSAPQQNATAAEGVGSSEDDSSDGDADNAVAGSAVEEQEHEEVASANGEDRSTPVDQHSAAGDVGDGESPSNDSIASPVRDSPSKNDGGESMDEQEEAEDKQSGADARSPSPANSAPAGSPIAGADLFGDADDIHTSSSEEDEAGGEHRRAAATIRSGSEAEGDEFQKHQEESAPVEETILNAEIPKINVDLGNNIHFVKFPNFLSVDPRPFDPETYEDEVDEDEVLDEEGRSRLKLKVENTIRWRLGLDEEGNLKRESNAKIVRWSDGSLSLYLGSEVFDVHTHPLQGDHHHLFIRQGTGLQGRNVFRTKLTFRPHSTDSFTHRKMTLSMADKTSKAQKVKVLPAVGKNPEAVKQELIKREEERMRASARRESQQRRMRERTQGRALSAAFLEPDRGGHDSDEGDVSLSAIKHRYKSGIKDIRGGRRPFNFQDDDEEEEEDEDENEGESDLDRKGGGGRQQKAGGSAGQSTTSKRIIESDEDDEDNDNDDNGSEPSGSAAGRKNSTEDRATTKRRATNVIAESDEDD